MAENKVRIEDHSGNVFYPHTKADIVFTQSGESVESQLAQKPNIEDVEQVIDESLGGAKIRDNNGVLETLVGSVWIPILKEGDVMPILNKTIAAWRSCNFNEQNFVKILDIQSKKGKLQSLSTIAPDPSYPRNSLMLNIKIDGVLVSLLRTTGTIDFSTEFSIIDLESFASQRVSGGSFTTSSFTGASNVDLEFKESIEVWVKNSWTNGGVRVMASAKTE